jgi:hypothetical protein
MNEHWLNHLKKGAVCLRNVVLYIVLGIFMKMEGVLANVADVAYLSLMYMPRADPSGRAI